MTYGEGRRMHAGMND